MDHLVTNRLRRFRDFDIENHAEDHGVAQPHRTCACLELLDVPDIERQSVFPDAPSELFLGQSGRHPRASNTR